MAESLPDDWGRWKDQVDLTGYDERWQRMAEAGENPHGEADLVASFRPASVLDAGCGTGRVGIELAQRGIRVVGVDADPDMIAAARAKAPDLDWRQVDLAQLDLSERFDVVVLAGNVIPYVVEGSRPEAVAACARSLAPGGRLIAGFSLRPGWPSAADFGGWCTDAGLELEDRFATWAGSERFTEADDYLVAIYRAICSAV